MAEKGTPSILASTTPLEGLIGCCTTFRTHHAHTWLCAAFREHDRSCSLGAIATVLKSDDGRCGFSLPSTPPAAMLPCSYGHTTGTSAALGKHSICYLAHFRQSPASYRAKALLQESTAFQNNRDGVDGSSGRKLSRPARRTEKRHPRPWHDALSTHSRFRMQTCSMGVWGSRGASLRQRKPIFCHLLDLCNPCPSARRSEGWLRLCILAEEHKIRSATRNLGIGQWRGS
ncbi:hypothetical protein IQ06DRAFT_123390 [Phaeosphaeriaceae sp. SRC1lsM3a]|nr:hypothetical protein IQ06DRAFT_123390 [Stagonospora sp. SRC1lsM3a]